MRPHRLKMHQKAFGETLQRMNLKCLFCTPDTGLCYKCTYMYVEMCMMFDI